MKKRFISIALILVFLFVGVADSALCDSFSVRNGVTFGMSFNEVKQVEAVNLPSTKPMEITAPDDGYPYMFYNAENFLGFEKCKVGYRFSPEDKLIRIMYSPYSCKQTEIDRVEVALSEKYGTPSNSAEGGSYNKFTAHEMETYEWLMNISNCLGTDYKQWLLPFDDCYVCLTFMYGKYNNYGNTLYKEADMYLYYNYIGLDEIDAEFNSQKQNELEEQEKMDQLLNDL